MRVVLVAGFSNPEIREHLSFRKSNLYYRWLIKLFHLPSRVGENRDYASWVVNIISDLKKRPDIELHVISHQARLKKNIEEFEIRGVFYHFFSSEWTSFCRLVRSYSLWKKLQTSTFYTRRLLKKIKPDLVILSGAENPATSVSIFAAQDYPNICLCQTIYNNANNSFNHRLDPLKQALEMDIFNNIDNLGVYCRKHYDLLKELGYKGHIYKFNYPTLGKLAKPLNVAKEYDFVNYAFSHSIAKGTHDSIKALAIVKESYPDVTLNIAGGCSEKLRQELISLINELGLQKNVIFTPFFEKKKDLLFHIQKSRFAVLPCKLDNTSGTMSQCMNRGIPIVVYRTAGTPAFNKEKQCALIAEMNNVEELARYMIMLMSNPTLSEELSKNGQWYKENKLLRDKANWERMVRGLYAICDYHKNGKQIPEDVLFNPDVDE